MLANSDKTVAETVTKACEDAAKDAAKFADQKKQDGGGMGDISKLMDAASKAMQAMQKKGDESPQTPESPAQTPAAVATATAPGIVSSKLDALALPVHPRRLVF